MVDRKIQRLRLFPGEIKWLKDRGFSAREIVGIRRILRVRDGDNARLIEEGLTPRRLIAYKGAVEKGIYKEF